VATCVIYIDEAGSPDRHDVPLQSGQTPLFTLAAMALSLSEWRARDREFLALKRQFFQDSMGREGRRDEEVEIKGRDLTSPHQKTSLRRQAFNRRVLSLAQRARRTTLTLSQRGVQSTGFNSRAGNKSMGTKCSVTELLTSEPAGLSPQGVTRSNELRILEHGLQPAAAGATMSRRG